ncbi:glycosyltransferase [uncultured Eudoraea sp.]|uniref:glycosyltransferase n=1 Tax=uncultured Eudoraea sp. TaxID=1035614 RepID=UPI002621235A|nr:glycosyltransferase [uncultured Eudoraea sp.]
MEKENNSNEPHIVFLGEAGFPLGLAAIQRMTLMARALVHAGCATQVVCRKGVWERGAQDDFPLRGTYKEIDYIYTSKSIYRPKSFFKRNMEKLRGIYREFVYLGSLKKQGKLDIGFLSTMSSFHLIRYRLVSWVIGFPIVLNFVELASSMKQRDSILKKTNDYIYDNLFLRLVDGAFPISEKLMEYYMHISPNKPCLKLPILCDFEKFQYYPKNKNGTEFLYCGAASYFELVDFVIEAFDHLNINRDDVYLKLVLGGKEGQISKIVDRIASARNKDHINLVTNVPHDQIPSLYAKASALLIPLRPTVQDAARFPHKIGEYLASGRPVITTAFGEIAHYDFIDGKTALIAEDFEKESYAQKMQFILTDPENSASIGINGRQMGLENFDYTQHGGRMLELLGNFTSKINDNNTISNKAGVAHSKNNK